jgi:hypothetical protein
MKLLLERWRKYMVLNEIEPYQKAVRKGYVKDRNQYLDTGPQDPGPAYPEAHPNKRGPAPVGFGAMEEEVEDDDEVLEEEEDGVSEDQGRD